MNILITGGTGSLGNALVESIIDSATFATDRICIYSRDEHKQELMKVKFKNDPKLRFFIGDVRDKDRLTLACRGIHLIVHAAAMKVVPTAEYNPFECLKTNVLGAQNLIEAALANTMGSYPKVLALSTDKAVHPINLYGATKLCAEKLFLDANNIMGEYGPRFSVARYGNVANSNGSVIPIFRAQVARREQVTITRDDMTRFWLTLDEAVKLVKYGLDKMYGREIFVPYMDAFNIKDLAYVMMKDYEPEKRWYKVMGVRPGEKLHEEIITAEECESTFYDDFTTYYTIRPGIYNLEYPKGPITSDRVHRMTPEELMKRVDKL